MKSRIALLLGASLTAVAAHAGVHIEMAKQDVKTGKQEGVQSMWIQNGMGRFESGNGSAAIFKDDTMYTLNNAKKSYMALDKATMEQAAGAMNDAMAKMRERMEKLPPDQRAMMEQMMKQRGMSAPGGMPQKQVVYDVQPAGGGETINGKSCKLWNVTRDGVLNEQLCVVPTSALPGADEVLAMSKKIAASFEKLNEQMRAQMSNGLQQSNAALAKINGYPIMTRRYQDGTLAPERFVLKTWEQQSVSASKFAIPADFTKEEMPKMGK